MPAPPLRILHVTPYSPDTWAYGGIPRLTRSLTDALADHGHDVTICTTDACDARQRLPHTPEGPISTTRGPSGLVRQRVFPNLSNRLAYRWQFFTPVGLGRFLRKHAGGFDIAHVHACRNVPGTMAARHCVRAGVPYLVAPNGTAPRIERRRFAKRVYDLVAGRGFFENAAGVLAVSHAERRQLLTLGVTPSRIHVLPNPLDLREFTPPPARGRLRARLGVGDAPLVLYLGQLTPRKRVDLLVEAFHRLEDSSAHLVIAGNDMGALASVETMTARLGLTGRTHVTGLLQGRDRLEALADADVVVYPSEHEVFGLVPLEALLAGTPVIVVDDSGCGEVIRQTGGGLVIAAGDVPVLADALIRVLQDREGWRRAAQDAAPGIRAAYDGRAVGAALADLYRSLIAR